MVVAILATVTWADLATGGPGRHSVAPATLPTPSVGAGFNKHYPVTFTESGLPTGTSWSVKLGRTVSSSTSSTISFHEGNGSYNYSVGVVAGYTAHPSSGTVTVAGKGVSVPIAFAPVVAPVYPVVFGETGLPTGTLWSVTLNSVAASSTTATIEFNETNGTYSYVVGTVVGFTATPTSGMIGVSGPGASLSVGFNPTPVPTYPVTFAETGLPLGTNWTLTFNGSATATNGSMLSFVEPNGSYPFAVGTVPGYGVTPSSGTVSLSGAGANVSLVFAALPPAEYSVGFQESGLPNATLWSVTLNGTLAASNTTLVEFNETNGTYSYSVGAVPGYSATPASGSVTVNALPVSLAVAFVANPPSSYPVLFQESGLPNGTSWSVTLNGTLGGSNTTSVAFSETNGTYPFVVGTVPGFAATPSSGSVVVAGSGLSVPLAFVALPPPTFPVQFPESGLPNGTAWGVNLSGTDLRASGPLVEANVSNGSYGFAVDPLPGFTVSPASGTVSVNGSGSTVPILFVPIVPPPPTFPVVFTEVGLVTGTSWSVTLNGTELASTNGSIEFQETNGTYPFLVGAVAGYSAAPGAGSVGVAGAGSAQAIVFTPVVTTYPVVFVASGIPTGTPWSVVLNGTNRSSTTGSIEFNETNGTYAFLVNAVPVLPGYSPSPSSGSITVSGAGPSTSIAFTAYSTLKFRETGLPNGLAWSVLVGSSTLTNTTFHHRGWVAFQRPLGTYGFSVASPPGYGVARVTGPHTPTYTSVNVTGRATIVLHFGRIEPLLFNETGLPSGSLWAVSVRSALAHGGPPGQNNTSTSSSLSFLLPQGGGPWAFSVTAMPSPYAPHPTHGRVHLPLHAFTRTIKFWIPTPAAPAESRDLAPNGGSSQALGTGPFVPLLGAGALLAPETTNRLHPTRRGFRPPA